MKRVNEKQGSNPYLRLTSRPVKKNPGDIYCYCFDDAMAAHRLPLSISRLKELIASYYVDGTIEKGESCWQWLGPQHESGYGRITVTLGDGSTLKLYIHRIVYQVEKGNFSCPISHLCGNRLCVRPLHLNAEPLSVNASRRRCHRQRSCTGHHQSKDHTYANLPDCFIV